MQSSIVNLQDLYDASVRLMQIILGCRIFKQRIIIILFIILLPGPSNHLFADDTLTGESGHTVFPIESSEIQMLSEKVSVRVDSYDSEISAYPLRRAFITCEFIFENTSPKTIIANVGFPGTTTQLNDFKSYIDGVEKNVKVKRERYHISNHETPGYRFWHIWETQFPPNRKVKLSNSYWVNFSSNQYVSFFEYILITGANWKGKIGRADITVEYSSPQEIKERVLLIGPDGYKINDNKIVWELKKLKPEENITILEIDEVWRQYIKKNIINDSFGKYFNKKDYTADKRAYDESDLNIGSQPGLFYNLFQADFFSFTGLQSSMNYYPIKLANPEEKIRLAYKAAEKRLHIEMSQLYLRTLRNEIFARHGRVFKSDDLRGIFQKTKWYKPNQNYSDNMLNEIEKKNLHFIINYENKMGWK